jgi:hypothetical protein
MFKLCLLGKSQITYCISSMSSGGSSPCNHASSVSSPGEVLVHVLIAVGVAAPGLVLVPDTCDKLTIWSEGRHVQNCIRCSITRVSLVRFIIESMRTRYKVLHSEPTVQYLMKTTLGMTAYISHSAFRTPHPAPKKIAITHETCYIPRTTQHTTQNTRDVNAHIVAHNMS